MLALDELISFLTGLRYKGMDGRGRRGRQKKGLQLTLFEPFLSRIFCVKTWQA